MTKMHSYTAQEAAEAIALQLAPTDERHSDHLKTAYYRALMKDLRAGLIVAASPSTHLPVPIDHPVPEVAFVVAKIKLDEVNRWLSKNDIPVELRAPISEPVASTQPDPVSAEAATVEQTWQQKAVAIANEIGRRRWRRGERTITARGISEAVAGELKADKATWGNRGARTSGTVRKHALKGWTFEPSTGGAIGASGASDEDPSIAPP
jgi:cytochrome c5